MSREIFTIGHSNLQIDVFLRLLEQNSIESVADVRSSPFSGRFPQFNRENLRAALRDNAIQYLLMGDKLGGRPSDPACYKDGIVQYDRVSLLPSFKDGIHVLMDGIENYRICLMCSEKDPINCHRVLLVCRNLKPFGLSIQHILGSAAVETNEAAEDRLLDATGLPRADLFETRDSLLDTAYMRQCESVGFSVQDDDTQAYRREAAAS